MREVGCSEVAAEYSKQSTKPAPEPEKVTLRREKLSDGCGMSIRASQEVGDREKVEVGETVPSSKLLPGSAVVSIMMVKGMAERSSSSSSSSRNKPPQARLLLAIVKCQKGKGGA